MKSVFSKTIVSTMGILLVGVLLLTFMLSNIYRDYTVEKVRAEMHRLGELISYRVMMFSTGDYFDRKKLIAEIDSFETYADVRVWFMTSRGQFFTTSLDMKVDSIYSEFDKEEIISARKTGRAIFRKAKFNEYNAEEFYTLIYPVKTPEQNSFIIFINKAAPDINSLLLDMNGFSLLTVFIVFMYASILLYFSTLKISNEIKFLNRGVKEMTKGNFVQELKVDRNDEIGELSRNLTEMCRAILNLENTRKKFISNISHDLRSPMTSIIGYVNGIIDGTIPRENTERYLKIVSAESQRMIKLINDILDLSKLQATEFKIIKKEIDINSLILEVMDKFEGKLRAKNADVSINFSEKASAFCDRDLIYRVINNLVDNAIKFMKENSALIIKTRFKSGKLLIFIRNTGSYIEPSKLSCIWERFTKLDDSRGTEKSSSGLGLAIVHEIIQSHGEKITVKSDEIEGVEFIFSLSTEFN